MTLYRVWRQGLYGKTDQDVEAESEIEAARQVARGELMIPVGPKWKNGDKIRFFRDEMSGYFASIRVEEKEGT